MKGRPVRDGDHPRGRATESADARLNEGPSRQGRRRGRRAGPDRPEDASMKGRPVRDGDGDPRPHQRRLRHVASMKGRPVRDGDLGRDGAQRVDEPASMKGRPVRDGDLDRMLTRPARCHGLNEGPSRQGRRPVGSPGRSDVGSRLNEGPSRQGRRRGTIEPGVMSIFEPQ